AARELLDDTLELKEWNARRLVRHGPPFDCRIPRAAPCMDSPLPSFFAFAFFPDSPAKAGAQEQATCGRPWTPAFAGESITARPYSVRNPVDLFHSLLPTSTTESCPESDSPYHGSVAFGLARKMQRRTPAQKWVFWSIVAGAFAGLLTSRGLPG